MDNKEWTIAETQRKLDTRHGSKKNKKPGLTHVIAKGKQFLMRHTSYYSFSQE